MSNTAEDYSLEREKISAQVNEFFKKFVKYTRKIKHDAYSIIKDHAALSGFDMPGILSEHFVYYAMAPWYWTFSNPANEYLHKLYNIDLRKLTSNNPQKLIFDFYNKWVFSNYSMDSKYFALSVIKQIRDSRKNALNLLIHGTILAYDKKLFNPAEALLQFEEAEKAINQKETEEVESLELRYIIKLFKGFVYYKLDEYEKARIRFEDALQFKEDGITAHFHLALVNNQIGNLNEAFEYAKKCLEFDIQTLYYAVEKNNTPIFEFLLENTVCSNFFSEENTAELLPIFENGVNDLISSSQVRYDRLKEDILILKDTKWFKENGEIIKVNINFIEYFLRQFNKSENMFILETLKKIEEKFVISVSTVLNEIKMSFKEKVDVQLKIYDVKIKEDEDLKVRIKTDFEKNKIRLMEKRESAIQSFDFTMEERIKTVDERIKNLEYSNELNPANSFKNSIMYSAMLSVLVLLLGGFAEYSNVYAQDNSGFAKMLSVVIFSGSKWGILTFVVGLFISLIMSASTSMEKAKVKQRYLKDITSLRDEKQRGIKRIKEDSEQALKSFEERSNKKIESIDAQIKELYEKRKEDEINLQENISVKVKEETALLNTLIAHYTE